MAESERPMCSNCRFFDPFGTEIHGEIGICRRYAPRPSLPIWVLNAESDVQGPGHAEWHLPHVGDEDWCGEHRTATA